MELLMREVAAQTIEERVRGLVMAAATELPEDIRAALEEARSCERSPLGREMLGELIRNASLAREEHLPICQDTGIAIVFARMGGQVLVTGGSLASAVSRGVERGYSDGYLRKSLVWDPVFDRKPTGLNTPASLHLEAVAGDELHIMVAAKGAGSENMSALVMLSPGDGPEGVKGFVMEVVSRGGARACPPLVVGVGVGGSLDDVALLAKRACLRPVGERSPEKRMRMLEDELLQDINRLGIGPLGLGGTTTALAVHVEAQHCHIASLPVAVVLNCHAVRRKEASL